MIDIRTFVPRRRGAVALKTPAQLAAMPERISMHGHDGVPSCYVMSAGAGFGVPYEAMRRDIYEQGRLLDVQRYPEHIVGMWTCAIFRVGEEIRESDVPFVEPEEWRFR